MRTALFSLLPILFGFAEVFAENNQEPPLFSFTLSSGFSSKYVIQNGLQLHDEAVHTQGTLFVPYGFYLDAFWSVGIDDSDFNSNTGDEIDWSAGWAKKVYGELGFDLRLSYYDLYKIFDYTKTDLIFPYAEINYGGKVGDWLNVTAYVAAENPFFADFDDMSQGLLFHCGLRPTLILTDSIDIVSRIDFLYDDGALGLDNAVIGRYEAGLLFKLTEHIAISAPWVKYSDIYTELADFDPRENEFWWGGGLVLTF